MKKEEIHSEVALSVEIQNELTKKIEIKRKRIKAINIESLELNVSLQRMYISLQNEIDIVKKLDKQHGLLTPSKQEKNHE